MELIFLDDKDELRMPSGTYTVDKVPPKSTYIDRNRSDIRVSESFCSPSEEVMNEVYEAAEKGFKEMIQK